EAGGRARVHVDLHGVRRLRRESGVARNVRAGGVDETETSRTRVGHVVEMDRDRGDPGRSDNRARPEGGIVEWVEAHDVGDAGCRPAGPGAARSSRARADRSWS